MDRIIGIALLVVGGLLLYWGYQTHESLGSQVSELVTGTPTDKAMWLLAGGAVSVAAGLFAMVRRRG